MVFSLKNAVFSMGRNRPSPDLRPPSPRGREEAFVALLPLGEGAPEGRMRERPRFFRGCADKWASMVYKVEVVNLIDDFDLMICGPPYKGDVYE
jgi:hypothetical protein